MARATPFHQISWLFAGRSVKYVSSLVPVISPAGGSFLHTKSVVHQFSVNPLKL